MQESPVRVLVVDDEYVARATLTDILQLENYQVTAVPTGEQALQKLQAESFDVMLLDIMMPGISGLEVLARLREKPYDIEVILLTAHSSVDSAVAALRHGAADYLIKPASPEDILAAVGKAVERRRQRQKQHRLLEQLEYSVRQLKGESEPAPVLREVPTQFSTSAQAEPAAGGGPPPRRQLRPGVWLDGTRRRIYYQGGEVVLSPTEARLLNALLAREGEVVSHKDLVKQAQGYDVHAWEAPEMLRPLVSRLRSKLSRIPGGREWIVNVRGVGYVLDLGGGQGGQ